MSEAEACSASLDEPESAAQFRAALDELGFSRADLVRFMMNSGDDRAPTAIDRSIYRMAKGQSRLSGEMRVLLTMLRNGRVEPRGKAEDAS